MMEESENPGTEDLDTYIAEGSEGTHNVPSPGEAKAQELEKAVQDLSGERYKLGPLIAEGGMGSVSEALDTHVDRRVAIKVTKDQDKASSYRNLRFIREGKITGQLEHPGIVPLYDLGILPNGKLYYSMKKVEGITLKDQLQNLKTGGKNRTASLPELLGIFLKICDAVRYAHAKQIIHRDLKPENIMVGEFGEVLVMDWGLAKKLGETEQAEDTVPVLFPDQDPNLTRQGHIMGSPLYMAPEQALGRVAETDIRTDIYQLGAILYSILTLRPPVTAKEIPDILNEVREGKVRHPLSYNPSKSGISESSDAPAGIPPAEDRVPLSHCPGEKIPASIASVSVKAMALDPDDRYATVEELQQDVEAYLHGFTTSAEAAGLSKRFALYLKRNRKKIALLFLCGMAALSGLWVNRMMVWQESKTLYNGFLQQGDRFMQDTAYPKAIDAYLAAGNHLKSEEGNKRLLQAYLSYARQMLDLENWELAAVQLEKARVLAPQNPSVNAWLPEALGRGFLYLDIGEPAELWIRPNPASPPERIGSLPVTQMEFAAGLQHFYIKTENHWVYFPQTLKRGKTADLNLSLPEIPEGYVYVHAGPFLSGDDATLARDQSVGMRPVILDSYFIRRSPVRIEEYLAFRNSPDYATILNRILETNGRKPSDIVRSATSVMQLHPHEVKWEDGETVALARGLSYWEARAYAEWAGGRLPTEQEWEKAVRGVDGRLFPEGGTTPRSRSNTIALGNHALLPENDVQTPYGCYGMTQVVWQWTSDPYWEGEPRYAVKGGTKADTPENARVSRRKSMDPDIKYLTVGFTLCKDLPPNTETTAE